MLSAQLTDARQSSWKHLFWVLFVGLLIFNMAYWYNSTQQNHRDNKVEMKSSSRTFTKK